MQRSEWVELYQKVDGLLRQMLRPGPLRPGPLPSKRSRVILPPAPLPFESSTSRSGIWTVLAVVLTVLIFLLCLPDSLLALSWIIAKIAAPPAGSRQEETLVYFIVLDSIGVVACGWALCIVSSVLWLFLVAIGVARKSLSVSAIALLALGWVFLAAYGIRVPRLFFR